MFYLFPYQRAVHFEKLITFHLQAFIVYKNGENLKMKIEIFYQKLIVSNVILVFLDHLKPKIFFVAMVANMQCYPFSKSLDLPLDILKILLYKYCDPEAKILEN